MEAYDWKFMKTNEYLLEMCYEGIVMFGQGTIKDPFLVRKYADVLSKRLSESYGHLVCFAILAKRQTERNSGRQKITKKMSLEKKKACYALWK